MNSKILDKLLFSVDGSLVLEKVRSEMTWRD